jgi:hypothetical protein
MKDASDRVQRKKVMEWIRRACVGVFGTMLGEVTAMERAEDPVPVSMPAGPIKVLAAAVTANVCLAIALHWKSYDWIHKFDAVLLASFLVTVPSIATWRRKEKRPFEWAQLWPAYMLLMIATNLFGMR